MASSFLSYIFYLVIALVFLAITIIISLKDKKINYAIIFNDKGEFISYKKMNKVKKSFVYNNHTYNINLKASTYHDIKRFFGLFTERYYYYSLNNPNPILLDKKQQPILDSEIYNSVLETKIATEINNLSKGSFSALLTPRNIIIVLIIIVVIYWGSTHGWNFSK